MLRRSQEGLKQILPSGFGGRGLAILVLVAVLAWLLSGLYTVGPNEIGLNLIFGKYMGKTQAGLNYNLPGPIGSVVKLAVTGPQHHRRRLPRRAERRLDGRRRGRPRASRAEAPEESSDADRRREHRRRQVSRHSGN
jgi:membrane protease subunit HflK